jgi:hypothetical protein
MQTVFISYSRKDEEVALKVRDALMASGLRVTIDIDSIEPGGDIRQFIERGIRETQVTLTIVSRNSLLSDWVSLETGYTHIVGNFQDKTFIPCHIENDLFSQQFNDDLRMAIDQNIEKLDREMNVLQDRKEKTGHVSTERDRKIDLKHNLGTILGLLKNTLVTDIRTLSFDQNIQKIIEKIKKLPPPPARQNVVGLPTEVPVQSSHNYNDYVIDKLLKLEWSFSIFQKVFDKHFPQITDPVTSISDIVGVLGQESLLGLENRKPFTKYGHLFDFYLYCVVQEDSHKRLFAELETEFPREMRPTVKDAISKVYNEYSDQLTNPPLYISVWTNEGMDQICWSLHHFVNGQFTRKLNGSEPLSYEMDQFEALMDGFIHLFDEELSIAADYPDEIHIRFYLNARQMVEFDLHHIIDPLDSEKKLPHSHPVIIASYERSKGISVCSKMSKPEIRASKSRWGQCFDRMASKIDNITVKWLQVAPSSDPMMIESVIAESNCIGFEERPSFELAERAIKYGAPFMLWPQRVDSSWGDCRKSIDRQLSRCRLADAYVNFPFVNKQHKEIGLVVFWDDPTRNPFEEMGILKLTQL